MLRGVLKRKTGSKFMLVALLVYFVLAHYVTDGRQEGLPTGQVLMTWLLLGLVAGIAYNKRLLLIGIGIAVPAIGLTWGGRIWGNESAEVAGAVFQVLELAYVSILVADHLWKQRSVTGEMLRLAVIAYLLIGFAFAGFYHIAEYLDPSSLGGLHAGGTESSLAEMLYFSFVTMTTLGYGDIVPKTPMARTAAMLQALIGQGFMAFIVAKLVALYWAQAAQDRIVSEEIEEQGEAADQLQEAFEKQAEQAAEEEG